ncbi:PLP-dependent aminotransferase family protein [Promicromonospora sp. NPDC050262]|uniref:MocR-like pyridoxine biosynthesis transcription factor PdxR n=1 Tax=Promicromonospora sp. NPDC050262 TaxID=3155036 RepID=UPI0034000AC2
MEVSQTNSGAEFLSAAGIDLHLEPKGPGVRAGLTDALRQAVRTGRLVPGTRLPASRTLAADLGMARSTVTECYAELVAEGWLTAQQGSGTRVAARPGPGAGGPTPPQPHRMHRRPAQGLVPGAEDFAEFPRTAWVAAARRALAAAPYDAFGYGDPLGRIELRSALAEYLARVRGVYAEPERIIISAGFHQGLGLLARALKAQGVRAVAVESYGLDLYRELLADAGLDIPALRVDADGARTGDLATLPGVGAVLLTPAHQFPTGVALAPGRRAAVLDWAHRTGGLIVEDDYDGEFRYDRQPIGALQGLDPERVAYFGTASKSLAPALRLAWMVLPKGWVPRVAAVKGPVEVTSVLDQLTFAELIASGGFDRHVRAMRQRYRRRRDQLITALAEHAPGVRVTGMAAGLQAVVELPPGTERAALRSAAQHGLLVSGLTEFRHEGLTTGSHGSDRAALVVNYSAVSDSAWPRALDTLCRIMPPGPGRRPG